MSEEFDRFEEKMAKEILDESHLPVEQQSLVYRLRRRAEIRRQIKDRKSVQEGTPDRIADLLEEAADEIEKLRKSNSDMGWALNPDRMGQ
jgi:flagellar biosynthesis/type III secretory pathway chaperone